MDKLPAIEIAFDEFIETLAYYSGKSIAEAQAIWDALPIGDTIGSLGFGAVTKDASNAVGRHSTLRAS